MTAALQWSSCCQASVPHSMLMGMGSLHTAPVQTMACVLRSGVANCPELGLVMIAFLILFSQFLRSFALPKRIPVIGG